MKNTVEMQEIFGQTQSLQEQIRRLREDLDSGIIGQTPPIIDQTGNEGGMINLLNNGDFTFNDLGYHAGAYADSDDYAAEWYKKASGTADWNLTPLPAGAVSSQALKDDDTQNSYWKKSSGVAHLGGGEILGNKLFKKYLTQGNRVYIRFQISKKSGAVIEPTITLRVSIYDNTAGQKKIIEGNTFDVSATRQGTAGAFTRKYILEVISPNGIFYSDVVTPDEVTDALSVTNATDPTSNYVEVSWTSIIEQQAYKLYRYDSEYAEWRQIAEITNGSTSFRDTGGRTGAIFTVPVSPANPKAQVEIKNAGQRITDSPQDTIISLRIPSTYNFSATDATGGQWFQIEALKADGTATTVTEVPAGAIVIDKVGLSLAAGKFMPSAKDQQVIGNIETTEPPVTTGGGGGTYIPPDGDGTIGCVVLDSLLYAYSEGLGDVQQVFAKNAYVGMLLIGKDAQGALKASRIKQIFPAKTALLYTIITEGGYMLGCSPSHPIIQTVQDTVGIHAFNLEKMVYAQEKTPILVSPDGKTLIQDYLLGVEIIRMPYQVVTFQMEDDTMTYIANGIVSHNREYKGGGGSI